MLFSATPQARSSAARPLGSEPGRSPSPQAAAPDRSGTTPRLDAGCDAATSAPRSATRTPCSASRWRSLRACGAAGCCCGSQRAEGRRHKTVRLHLGLSALRQENTRKLCFARSIPLMTTSSMNASSFRGSNLNATLAHRDAVGSRHAHRLVAVTIRRRPPVPVA